MDFLDAVADDRLWAIELNQDSDEPTIMLADRLWPLKAGGIVWVDSGWNATVNPGMSAHKIEGEVTGKNPWFIDAVIGKVCIRNQTESEAESTERVRAINGVSTEDRALGYVAFWHDKLRRKDLVGVPPAT